MGYIYRAYCNVSQKGYTGLTTKTFEERKNKHISSAINLTDNYYFHNALREYGEENFEWTIIGEFDNAYLSYLESYFIFAFGDYGYGYNMTPGGEGVRGQMTEEQRQANKERNMKNANRVYWAEGKKWFDSLNECSNELNIDVSSISRCVRGIRLTAGKQHFSNIEITIEEIEKYRKISNSPISVRCIDLNMIFDNMTAACNFFGENTKHGYWKIEKAIKNNKTYMGYYWEYVSAVTG